SKASIIGRYGGRAAAARVVERALGSEERRQIILAPWDREQMTRPKSRSLMSVALMNRGAPHPGLRGFLSVSDKKKKKVRPRGHRRFRKVTGGSAIGLGRHGEARHTAFHTVSRRFIRRLCGVSVE